ncbi:MAG TPA: hypothetical protein DEP48_04455 [Persephonella sp.]|uniref:Uncharacterized protein n=1 Tax=Persephonella marina (strain DSM 14350 / EX-H1) TaxID=123214 RepID=C0QQ51_PERMH|nr:MULTISPECIES: hypothetical protein [Persephonella]ACO03493.1 hypothetical protein PERMA_1011 [Persephonella marina EX-H1]HCB69588.1 hypothetical protein [Persephonella sp.]
MGKIIIEIPGNIEETIKIKNERDIEETLERLKMRIKRVKAKETLDKLIGSFEIEEDIDEEDIYSRGRYE